MRKFFLTTVAAAALAASTAAADDHMSLDGLYIGAHAGWTWAEAESIDQSGYNLFGERTDSDDDAFSGGLQAGLDEEFGQIFVGLAMDITFTGIDGEGVSATVADTFYTTEIDWYGTFRVRAGGSFDRFKLYATAGVALVDVDARVSDTSVVIGPLLLQAESEDRELGWVVGAGGEAMISDNVGLGAEYLFIDVNPTEFSGVASDLLTYSFKQDVDLHVGRVTLNWHF